MEKGTGSADRERIIIRTSVIGILTNVLLAAVKAAVGTAAHSVAVVSDAVNNLSDALSSVLTIVGAKLAGRPPDKAHPLGYGRIEYMSAAVVSSVVLYAGITTTVESVKKIVHPEEPDYPVLSLILLAAAVGAKLILGAYTKRMGQRSASGSLTASGEDALQDAVLSSSVLGAALLYRAAGVDLEAWVGALIGIFIVRSGAEMVSEAVDQMLGARPGPELSAAIRETIASDPQVLGVYDLLVTDYGPERRVASVHVEVEDRLGAAEIDALSRRLAKAVYRERGVLLAAVGIYAAATGDSEAARIREDVRRLALAHEGALQAHGIFVDREEREIFFDLVPDFSVDRAALCRQVREEVETAWPGWKVQVALDVDLSD